MKFLKWMKTLLMLSIIVLASCNEEIKKKVLPTFAVNVPGIQLTIPAIKFVSDKELPVGALKAPLNLDSTLKANTSGTFGAASITSVRVKNITLRVTNADTLNHLGNFETARMKIYNDSSSAEILNIKFPEYFTDSINIIPANQPEIVSFLKGKTLAYNLFWKNRKRTAKSLKLKVNITFVVQ
jgi:hypothetical protein